MDLPNTYVGAIPLDSDLPTLGRFAVEGLGFLAQLVMGSGAAATGLACTPGSGLTVSVSAGSLLQLSTLAPVASGPLPVDNTPCVQQGINTAATTLTLGAGTWTIYGSVSVSGGAQAVLPYFNAANPSQPLSGPGNSGQPVYTQTQARVALGATTGTIPAGSVALYTVAVPNGATNITQATISQAANGPFWLTVPQIAAKIGTVIGAAGIAESTTNSNDLLAALQALFVRVGGGVNQQSGHVIEFGLSTTSTALRATIDTTDLGEIVTFGNVALGGWQEQYYALTGNTTRTLSASFTVSRSGIVRVMASANLATQSTSNVYLDCAVNGTRLSADNTTNSTGLTNHGVMAVSAGTVTVTSTFGSAASGTSPNCGHTLSYDFIPS
ncbi:hypothetical protein NFI95_15500 [Acetobacteraceae bacterium KSS8]|uniref:Uncharacterized protein n=1 Tax=Endosaccharibacter trunci TaxID=2812733 RepID=A0ABT1WAC8_9PROT|nr:hypothetical protein [Acetobacteraceae bacterium KSS8]